MTEKTLNSVNEHCLDSVMKLAETNSVTASEDVFDAKGNKLLAKGAAINPTMKERLIQHKLHKPLETSLTIVNGLDLASVLAEAKFLLKEIPALDVFIGNEQASVFETLSLISFQPAAALLLTAAEKSREGVFRHSILVTLIAVALGIHQKMAHSDRVSLAIASLLHDIGELYIDPVYLDAKRTLNPEEWKHVVAHPRVGQIALSELTNYPKMVLEAVGNHHERLDGSGYPRQLSGQQIHPLAQILSMAETLSGILMRKGDVLTRSCLALKCIPGEYPRELISIVSMLKREYNGTPFPPENIATETLNHTQEISNRLANATAECKQISQTHSLSPAALTLLQYTENRLTGLRQAIKATGIDECTADANMLAMTQGDPELMLEIDVIGNEIGWRMRNVARDLHIRLGNLAPESAPAFSGLIKTLDNRKA